jgi:CRISPR-associated protein Cas2
MDTYLVAYDICNPKRLKKVAKVGEDFGMRRQYSVFFCRLAAVNLVRFKARLYDVIDLDQDQVLLVPLCGRCASAIEALGRPIEAHDVRDVVIISRLSDSRNWQCIDRTGTSTIRREQANMSHPVLTLELPEDVYERVRRAAKGMNQPVEKALVNIVRAATPSLEKVPPECRPELEAMEDLGDEELGRILRSRPAPARQRRLERLLDKGQRGELTDRERQALSELRAEGNRVMLHRSYAALLLKYRGHRLPKLEDL